mgnify:CR=1 FL=1
MKSRRLKQFKQAFAKLPQDIRERSRQRFRQFLKNPNNPSFHVKLVQATRRWTRPHWEYRIDTNYRATCFHDADTAVWVFIGNHDEFEQFYS